MTAFETSFEAQMEENNLFGAPVVALKARPNNRVIPQTLDKTGSFNTVSTATDSINFDDYSPNTQGKSPSSSFAQLVSNSSMQTPNKKKIMMSISKAPKTPVLNKPSKASSDFIYNDDSFKEADDSNWWQSPKNLTEKCPDTAKIESTTQSNQGQEADGVIVDEEVAGKAKTSDKKKKVKRISMIKVKASDINGLSAHQYQKTGDHETDQKELQKVIMQWKAEQKLKGDGVESTENRGRSKSKLRSRKEAVDPSDDAHNRRSHSIVRRASDTQIVDLTNSDGKRAKSVSRRSSDIVNGEKQRSRSVARKEITEIINESNDAADDGKHEARSRGRSVGAKRSSGKEKETGRSSTSDTNPKPQRERSRSVARQRPVENDDSSEENDDKPATTRSRSVAKNRNVDLSVGLEKVDKDTRSRSVARQRPGEELQATSPNTGRRHSLKSSVKSSAKSINSEGESTKSSAKSISSDGTESTGKRRTKSLARKPRNRDSNTTDANRGRSIVSGNVSSDDDTLQKKRSKSIGPVNKKPTASSNIIKRRTSLSSQDDDFNESNTQKLTRHKTKATENDDTATTEQNLPPSKTIPWTEFLMNAQSSTGSLQ